MSFIEAFVTADAAKILKDNLRIAIDEGVVIVSLGTRVKVVKFSGRRVDYHTFCDDCDAALRALLLERDVP